MQQPDYSTKTIGNSWKKQLGFIYFKSHAWILDRFNMNIRCNQKFMFCKERGMDFSINNNYYII